MKIRHCFVSNSSSSSFIIGLAKTDDESGTKFDSSKLVWSEWYKCNTLEVNNGKWSDDVKVHEKEDGSYKLEIESFMGTSVTCNIKDGEYFLYVDGAGPGEDSFFSVYDDSGDWVDIDYDRIELDDFDKEDVEKFSKILKLGGDATYGAGRNG
ncbi:MAG: hypothetical protein RBS24_07255 [Bacilli bacterium]|nr:hypothetical protein [Bacilli bacterium]